jgi:hypothetical protein
MKHISTYKLFEDNHEKETFPSEEFGKATGMDWIYVDWKIPGTPDEVAQKLKDLFDDLEKKNKAKKAADSVIELYKEFLKLNPEMQELEEPTSWLNLYDYMHGAISKFNIDDINFYANMDWDDRVKYNMSNRKLMDDIAKKAGVDGTGWVMSPTTVARVKKELKM